MSGIVIVLHAINADETDYDTIRESEGYIAMVFPFMLNLGFCTSAGSYALMPVGDREHGTRSILHSSGMSTLSYWFGLFVVDYALYGILVGMFGAIILAVEIYAFHDFFGIYILETMIFGVSLISFTYFLSNIF